MLMPTSQSGRNVSIESSRGQRTRLDADAASTVLVTAIVTTQFLARARSATLFKGKGEGLGSILGVGGRRIAL
jgi:hypothetical protein